MKDFRDLQVWAKAHALAIDIYRSSSSFPKDETYGLRSQLRRAAVSIGANIAEGCGRGTDRDFSRFLQMAMGSACEVEYLLLLSSDLGFLGASHEPLSERVQEVKRMLAAFLRKLTAES